MYSYYATFEIDDKTYANILNNHEKIKKTIPLNCKKIIDSIIKFMEDDIRDSMDLPDEIMHIDFTEFIKNITKKFGGKIEISITPITKAIIKKRRIIRYVLLDKIEYNIVQ